MDAKAAIIRFVVIGLLLYVLCAVVLYRRVLTEIRAQQEEAELDDSYDYTDRGWLPKTKERDWPDRTKDNPDVDRHRTVDDAGEEVSLDSGEKRMFRRKGSYVANRFEKWQYEKAFKRPDLFEKKPSEKEYAPKSESVQEKQQELKHLPILEGSDELEDKKDIPEELREQDTTKGDWNGPPVNSTELVTVQENQLVVVSLNVSGNDLYKQDLVNRSKHSAESSDYNVTQSVHNDTHSSDKNFSTFSHTKLGQDKDQDIASVISAVAKSENLTIQEEGQLFPEGSTKSLKMDRALPRNIHHMNHSEMYYKHVARISNRTVQEIKSLGNPYSQNNITNVKYKNTSIFAKRESRNIKGIKTIGRPHLKQKLQQNENISQHYFLEHGDATRNQELFANNNTINNMHIRLMSNGSSKTINGKEFTQKMLFDNKTKLDTSVKKQTNLKMHKRTNPCLFPEISTNPVLDKMIDSLSRIDFPFLSNYRSPCWYEPLFPGYHREYRPSVHMFPDQARTSFTRIIKVFHTRQGQHKCAWRLRCLPLVYIIGVAKCGTSDLFETLSTHPHIVQGATKEPFYWDTTRWDRGTTFSDYLNLFDEAAEIIRRTTVKTSTSSLYHPSVTIDASVKTLFNFKGHNLLPGNTKSDVPKYTAADLIRNLYPQKSDPAKVVVIIRNPIERLFSSYVFYNTVTRPSSISAKEFHDLSIKSMDRLKDCFRSRLLDACVYDQNVTETRKYVTVHAGLYYVYLKAWIKVFPHMQIIRTEDYRANRTAVYSDLVKYIGLEPVPSEAAASDYIVGEGPVKKFKMWPKTKKRLQKFYKPFNQLLSDLLNDTKYLFLR